MNHQAGSLRQRPSPAEPDWGIPGAGAAIATAPLVVNVVFFARPSISGLTADAAP
jgi:ABC-type glycerol-3-phosphate transport system permease component